HARFVASLRFGPEDHRFRVSFALGLDVRGHGLSLDLLNHRFVFAERVETQLAAFFEYGLRMKVVAADLDDGPVMRPGLVGVVGIAVAVVAWSRCGIRSRGLNGRGWMTRTRAADNYGSNDTGNNQTEPESDCSDHVFSFSTE